MESIPDTGNTRATRCRRKAIQTPPSIGSRPTTVGPLLGVGPWFDGRDHSRGALVPVDPEEKQQI